MSSNNIESPVTFYELKWDTEFFGVSSAKLILHKSLDLEEWVELHKKCSSYQFVSIENRNSDPINSYFICKYTKAILVDVNIQFEKKISRYLDKQPNIEIIQALGRNDQIIDMAEAEFQFSKFVDDPELAKRGGGQVYKQWVINSFGNPSKYFAILRNDKNDIIGFLLHSYQDDTCIVELIAIAKGEKHGGIGTSLFKAIENEACVRNCQKIMVGTQARNIIAMNFYHKVGCKQIGCHQVYHFWNS